ncbi:cyclin-dependent kinase inhibitor 1B [Anopheles maculipalpis]|uniref:cyclin-dependent kinase inhibitor 1B n=1 Tax=Anopheles maculipalpis TaxID=1496333 RepID=UPI002158B484|nr:cyclin-dependent kinase inhibitor 1B [Anopheles maculipalpis]
MGAQVCNRTVAERLRYSPAPVPMKSNKRQSPAPTKLNGAKRKLFGDSDREELNRFYDKHMKEQDEAKQKKWNFNFRKGVPLDGQFKWMLPHECSVIALTQAAHVIPTAAALQAASDVQRSSSAGDTLSNERMDERSEPASGSSSVPKLRQPKITDFMKERKRRLSSTVSDEKKVRLLAPPSASSDGAQQPEASTSSAN